MFSFEIGERATRLADPASARQWLVSPLGRYVLTNRRGGAVAVAMEGAGPVLLRAPRPGFRWPAEFAVDDIKSTVTVPDPDSRPGEPRFWTWHIPHRIVASIALPEPEGAESLADPTSQDGVIAAEPDGTVISPDGRFRVTYPDSSGGYAEIEDAVSGKSRVLVAGSYEWPVGGPWWSPDGEWLLCSWYTNKSFSHGQICAFSRESLDRHFADDADDSPIWSWTIREYPNGVPFPERADEVGSYEAISVAGFSPDGSAVYFVDAHTVSGFSLPHFVPLFRVPRPELAVVRHTVTVPGAGVPFMAWTSRDRLVVATRDGQVGSIWLDLGLAWISERDIGASFLAFDADASKRVAVTDSGGLLWWDVGTEPQEIGVFPKFVTGPCAVGFLDDGIIIAGGPGGDLLLIDGHGKVQSKLHTGLCDVASLQVSADRSHVVVVSSAAECRRIEVAEPTRAFASRKLSHISHAALSDSDDLILIDTDDFLHLNPQTKRHVNQDGTLGPATAPEIFVVFMNEVVSRQESGNGVLALSCHPTAGVAVATRSGLVCQFDPAGKDSVATNLGGAVAERLRFSPDGEALAAAGHSAIHLLIPLS